MRRIFTAISSRKDGNMGLHTGDNPSDVISNRKMFLEKHTLSLESLITADQVHGDAICIVSAQDRGKGATDHSTAIPSCDALITTDQDITLGIVTADCVPILLWDSHAHIIAAIHAGWKGTAKHITKKCVEKMVALGASPTNLFAFIAPAIGACCYEVGKETATACGCANATHLDLKLLNEQHLLASSLLPSHITVSPLCTSCHNNLYFSYRADAQKTGRIMATITISSK